MTNIVRMHADSPAVPDMSENIEKMMDALQAMATLLRATNMRMQALEEQVRRLEKVTPAQASELNRLIRERSAEVCRMHRAAGGEKAAAAAIRKHVKTTCGVSGMRDLPRVDYKVAVSAIGMWDDYQVMRRIRDGAAKRQA